MSWIKRLFGKCCNECKPCGDDQMQTMEASCEPKTQEPQEPMGEEDVTVE